MAGAVKIFKEKLMQAYLFIAGAALLLLIIAAFVQVFTRYIMNASMSWTEEISRFAFIWCSLLGAAIAVDQGLHASITIIEDKLHGTAKKYYQMGLLAFVFIMAVLITAVGFQLAAATQNMYSPAVRLPMWVVNVPVGIGGFGMAVASLSRFLEMASPGYIMPQAAPEAGEEGKNTKERQDAEQ